MKKSKMSTFIIGGAIVLSLILFVIGSGAGGPRGGNALPHGAAANVGASVERGDANFAPDFTLETLNGGPLTLSNYRGVKPVILDFFATWCPNCRRNIPHEVQLYSQYGDRIEVVGVNLQENPALVKSFANKNGVNFPIVLDPRGIATNSYGVRYTNFKVLIDKKGRIVRFIPGDISESDFQSLLEA